LGRSLYPDVFSLCAGVQPQLRHTAGARPRRPADRPASPTLQSRCAATRLPFSYWHLALPVFSQ
jgi:hypothetical protein